MKKRRKVNYIVWFFGIMEFLVAGYLGIQLFPLIPTLYFCILVIAELVIVLLMALAVKRTWSAIIMSLLALILTFVLCIGIQVLGEVTDMLDKVTDNTTGETIDMNVIVNKDDNAEDVTDVADYRVGYLSEKVSEGACATMEQLDAQLDGTIEYVEYQDIVSMVDDLFAGELDTVIINSAYLAILAEQDNYTDIYDKIKTLASFLVEGTYQVSDGTTDTESEHSSEIAGNTNNNHSGTGNSNSGNSSNGNNNGWQSNGPTGMLGHSGESAIKDGTFLIYISGIDTAGNPNVRRNSDVNILAAVNTKTKTVQLINTPRDFYITIPTSKGNLDKLTHAGCYGIDCSVGALEDLYNINIDYYVKLNFDGFKEIIDAMGGVDVYTEHEFYIFKKGYNHLDGFNALIFARERYSFATGDHQRGKNQMAVITAMIQKLSNPEVLVNYAELLEAISGSFVTNFSSDEIYSLVKGELENPGAWKVESYAVSGTGASDYCYSLKGIETYVMIPDYETVNTAKAKIYEVLK